MAVRPIIFRAKRKDNGEWVEGFYVRIGKTHFIFTGKLTIVGLNVDFECYEVIPETVGQFTGELDFNGKKIFEGDIVSHPYLRSPQVVEWNNEWCAFAPIFDARPIESFPLLSQTNEIEVIGNVIDNPELLEEQK